MFPDIQQLNSVHQGTFYQGIFATWQLCSAICPSQKHMYDTCQLEWREYTNNIFPLMAIVQYTNVFPMSVLTLSIFCLRFQWQLFFWQLMLYYIHRSIIGKDICTYCRKPLGIDAKMILDALQIYCHSTCFKVRFHLLPRNITWL